MKYIYMFLMSVFFIGCSPIQKGDYITYTSDDYIFMQDSFINQKMDCLELGKMKEGGLDVKYCVGYNYASALVQGFIFEHNYNKPEERFIGATLSFKTKETFVMQCLSQTVNDAPSGKEYINCMIPQRDFPLYAFIQSSKENINGEFRAPVGDRKVFKGVIGKEGKILLKNFYKELENKKSNKWKNRSL